MSFLQIKITSKGVLETTLSLSFWLLATLLGSVLGSFFTIAGLLFLENL